MLLLIEVGLELDEEFQFVELVVTVMLDENVVVVTLSNVVVVFAHRQLLIGHCLMLILLVKSEESRAIAAMRENTMNNRGMHK